VRSSAVDVTSGAVTSGVRIVLPRGGTVAGRVSDDHGAPLAGVELRFDAVSSVLDSSASTRSYESGQYRLEGAPAGLFTLRVQKDGFRVRLLSGLRVEPGGTLRQDVALAPATGGATLELGGIGATLQPAGDGIAFGQVLPGDPAARAGLRGGDVIVRIDGESTQAMSIADALQRLRGEPGTVVGVTVKHPDTGEIADVTIVRATVVH
jgi:S1-C subfamily serine protease